MPDIFALALIFAGIVAFVCALWVRKTLYESKALPVKKETPEEKRRKVLWFVSALVSTYQERRGNPNVEATIRDDDSYIVKKGIQKNGFKKEKKFPN